MIKYQSSLFTSYEILPEFERTDVRKGYTYFTFDPFIAEKICPPKYPPLGIDVLKQIELKKKAYFSSFSYKLRDQGCLIVGGNCPTDSILKTKGYKTLIVTNSADRWIQICKTTTKAPYIHHSKIGRPNIFGNPLESDHQFFIQDYEKLQKPSHLRRLNATLFDKVIFDEAESLSKIPYTKIDKILGKDSFTKNCKQVVGILKDIDNYESIFNLFDFLKHLSIQTIRPYTRYHDYSQHFGIYTANGISELIKRLRINIMHFKGGS